MGVKAGFDARHEGFVVVPEVDYARAGGADWRAGALVLGYDGDGEGGRRTLRDVEVGAGEAVEGGEGGGHVDAVLDAIVLALAGGVACVIEEEGGLGEVGRIRFRAR